MDPNSVNKFMNIVFAPLALIALFFFLRPYNYLRSLISMARSIFREDVAGKVVLITGASSGIGERFLVVLDGKKFEAQVVSQHTPLTVDSAVNGQRYMAYEYARRGACLALVARRKDRLREVAEVAAILGSPNAVYITGDVSILEDCKRFVDATINHFGRLDHLVTNAGILSCSLFEEFDDVSKAAQVMDINYWGSVYCTYFAHPHLKRSKGRIIAIASAGGWLPTPRLSFYSASKAAVISMYDSLRVEFGSSIGITVVTPGLVESEMTEGKIVAADGRLKVDKEIRDVQVSLVPLVSTETCAKAIVDSACRGEKNLTVPAWAETTILWKVFCPEIIDWGTRLLLMPGTILSEPLSKKLLDLTNAAKEIVFPYV